MIEDTTTRIPQGSGSSLTEKNAPVWLFASVGLLNVYPPLFGCIAKSRFTRRKRRRSRRKPSEVRGETSLSSGNCLGNPSDGRFPQAESGQIENQMQGKCCDGPTVFAEHHVKWSATLNPPPPSSSLPPQPRAEVPRDYVHSDLSAESAGCAPPSFSKINALAGRALPSGKFSFMAEQLYKVRKYKEGLLSKKRTPTIVNELNRSDIAEVHICNSLYSNFVSQMFQTDYVQMAFDKDYFDRQMELCFGSLDTVGTGIFKLHPSLPPLTLSDHAAQIFSCYLARKVWCVQKWSKFATSLQGFLDRVVNNPITRPVNEKAKSIAIKILEAICDGMDPTEYIEREYAPEGACIENPKRYGGKRVQMHFSCASDARHVVPCAIYTGGKIRVITVDSVYSTKYIWVNKFLSHCFRRLPLSIFGGRVEDWFDRCCGTLIFDKIHDPDLVFVSGDLEAATDNFDGRLTKVLIRRFVEMYKDFFPLSVDEEVEAICSFTTDCVFKVGKDFHSQTRGQMMGSILSFPFLCILSLTATLFVKSDKWLDNFLKSSPRKNFSRLSAIRDLGINGDDTVFQCRPAEIQRWVDGVHAIGGVVSRGKTLVNPLFFTVNSELWSTEGLVPALRPSLVTALTQDNKYYISPAREWSEYCNTKYVCVAARDYFDLVNRLKLDIPRAWGGLQIVKRFDPHRARYYAGRAKHQKGHVLLFSEAAYKDKKQNVEMKRIWVDREQYRAIHSTDYDLAKWAVPISMFREIKDRFKIDRYKIVESVESGVDDESDGDLFVRYELLFSGYTEKNLPITEIRLFDLE